MGSRDDFGFLQCWLKKEEVLQQERGITIENCPTVVSLPEVDLPSQLRSIEIRKCNALESFPETWMRINGTSLSLLYEENINNGSSENSSLLKYLAIHDCRSLTSLFFETELPASLEHIELRGCSKLASLTSNGNLPKALKWLHIDNCSKLEAIAERWRIAFNETDRPLHT
ncbi:hypothetical protein Q3G72_004025 [Acer saccharum]|nr:hypothetical protein Q3G72_004025 [Acer saccharum]